MGEYTFSVKGHIVNTLGFASHAVFIPTTHLSYCSMKAAIDNTWNFIYKNRQKAGFGPQAVVLSTPGIRKSSENFFYKNCPLIKIINDKKKICGDLRDRKYATVHTLWIFFSHLWWILFIPINYIIICGIHVPHSGHWLPWEAGSFLPSKIQTVCEHHHLTTHALGHLK